MQYFVVKRSLFLVISAFNSNNVNPSFFCPQHDKIPFLLRYCILCDAKNKIFAVKYILLNGVYVLNLYYCLDI